MSRGVKENEKGPPVDIKTADRGAAGNVMGSELWSSDNRLIDEVPGNYTHIINY